MLRDLLLSDAYIFKTYILPLLPSLLTILGWYIVYKTNNASRANTIHNKRIELAQKTIDEIAASAKTYYSYSGNDDEARKLQPIITTGLQKLSAFISLVSDQLKDEEQKYDLQINFIAFRKIISGGKFGTISRNKFGPDNQIYSDINLTSINLFLSLERNLKI